MLVDIDFQFFLFACQEDFDFKEIETGFDYSGSIWIRGVKTTLFHI